MWIIFFIGLGVVVMALLAFSVLVIMKKEGEAQKAADTQLQRSAT